MNRFFRVLFRPLMMAPWFVGAASILGGAYPYLWNLMPSHIDKVFRTLIYTPLEAFFYAYLLGWIVVLTGNRKWVKGIFMALFWLLFAGECISLISTGTGLESRIFELVNQTNFAEIGGFFREYFNSAGKIASLVVLLVIGLIIAVVGSVGNWTLKSPSKRLYQFVLSFILIIALAFGLIWFINLSAVFHYRDKHDFEDKIQSFIIPMDTHCGFLEMNRFADLVSKFFIISNYFRVFHIDYEQWGKTLEGTKDCKASLAAPSDSLDILVIIGESFKRNTSQLYGYPMPNMPRLKSEADSGRLVLFSDVITAANFTSGSVQNMISLNDLSQGEYWANVIPFTMVMHNASYNVALYDNQSIGFGKTFFEGNQGLCLWHPEMQRTYSVFAPETKPYDGEFLNSLPPLSGKHRLYVYHLMGQHFPYHERVPKGSSCNVFTAADVDGLEMTWTDDEERRDIASYLNATLYNDSVVCAIFNGHLSSRPAIALYFSDHGIDLYDAPGVDKRTPDERNVGDRKAWLRRNFDIPFMVWMSPTYMQRYPEKVLEIFKAKDNPGMLDNLGQIVLGLAGVQSSSYRPERDLLSKRYIPLPRVTATGWAYDSIMGNCVNSR